MPTQEKLYRVEWYVKSNPSSKCHGEYTTKELAQAWVDSCNLQYPEIYHYITQK